MAGWAAFSLSTEPSNRETASLMHAGLTDKAAHREHGDKDFFLKVLGSCGIVIWLSLPKMGTLSCYHPLTFFFCVCMCVRLYACVHLCHVCACVCPCWCVHACTCFVCSVCVCVCVHVYMHAPVLSLSASPEVKNNVQHETGTHNKMFNMTQAHTTKCST